MTAPVEVRPQRGAASGTLLQVQDLRVEFSGRNNRPVRAVRGLTYQIAYTWSKNIDNGSTTWQGGNESQNSISEAWAFCSSCQRGVSDFDVPHNFVFNFQYDVPTFAAVKNNAVANTILVMGSERVGNRLGRFLCVVKHRGSAKSDEIAEYRVTERGIEFV